MLSLGKASLWPLPARLAGAALMALLAAMLLYLAWLDGLVSALQAAQGEERGLRATWLQAQARAARLPAWREQRRQARAELASLELQLPDSQQMAALLSAIHEAARSRGLQSVLFKPGAPQPQAHYVALPLAIELRGGFHAMGQLLADLARLPRIVTVHGLTLTTDKDGALLLDAVLRAYRLPDAAERAAQTAASPPLPTSTMAWHRAAAFMPRPYDAAALADPFGMLPVAPQAVPGGVAGPDVRRPREPLESVALSAISMVGSVRQGGRLSALLLAGQRVHAVAVGQHLGQDHGVVTDISEQALQYRELLREADGVWRERRGSLALQKAGEAGKAAREGEQ